MQTINNTIIKSSEILPIMSCKKIS